MHCPHCRTILIEVPTLQSPQIDVCPNRHGLWLDARELNLFLEEDRQFTGADSAGVSVGAHSTSVCPRCTRLLDEHIVSGEGLFTCASCQGSWVPEGVLTRLHDAHRGRRASIPLDEMSLYTRGAWIQSARRHRPPSLRRTREDPTIALIYWLTLIGIVSTVIALLIAESVRRAVAQSHWTGRFDDGVFVLTVGAIGGLVLFFCGLRLNSRKRLIETTPTSSIRSLAVGLVEITGRAEAVQDTLSAPFSGMPCVFFFYTVEERQRSGKQDKWLTIASGQSPQPFAVRDTTGSVMILPAGADLVLEARATYRNSPQMELSPTVEARLAELGIASCGWLSSRILRCTEGFILPEEAIYVLGTAQAGDQNQIANEARLFIGRYPGATFMISDRGERNLLARLRWQVLVLLYGGPALAAACVWGLLHSYDPLKP